jgi:endonuclease/exonuclease/phosphatase (EEP) superfamily protein YafD
VQRVTRKAWSGLLVLVIAFSITGAARTEDLRVLQMNLCNSGLAGCYTGRSVATAADVIRAQAPDVVTVNEVCQADVAVLARGGPSAFRAVLDSRTGGATRCRNGDAYGIAILTRRPVSRVTGGTYATQNPNDPEQRAWLCVDTGDISACTTHLDARSTAVARSQCRYLLGTVLPAMRSPVVLAGDLNLRAGVRNCLSADERNADDGGFQNVVVTGTFAITSTRVLDMRSTTDHPGLLVTLAPR